MVAHDQPAAGRMPWLRLNAVPIAVAGLAVVAAVHGLDLTGKLKETPYVGVLYIVGPIASSLVAALLLTLRRYDLGFLLAGLVCSGTFLGYCVSRTTGLPGARDDIGNWGEPSGVLSLVAEAIVVTVAVVSFRRTVGEVGTSVAAAPVGAAAPATAA